MNPSSSTDSSIASSTNADAVSRRAYELWENEGRPEGSDLRHWLQAEQELGISPSAPDVSSESERTGRAQPPDAPRSSGGDPRSLHGSRGSAPGMREPKRNAPSPFGDKTASGNDHLAARRKSTSAPAL